MNPAQAGSIIHDAFFYYYLLIGVKSKRDYSSLKINLVED